jgi:hypothetical protein
MELMPQHLRLVPERPNSVERVDGWYKGTVANHASGELGVRPRSGELVPISEMNHKSVNPSEKPEPLVCPRQFCFFWRMDELIHATVPEPGTVAAGCRCPFGVCIRCDVEEGDRDWYEPHEPNLEHAALPWFYFVPTPEKLVPGIRARYIQDSEALWGKRHWEK